ncbi:MAG TPA: hypothetical protein VFQ61_09655 [Polyangiaceae bacterium]|nr:hypothetical protein [Polyangiaceae bacterium]
MHQILRSQSFRYCSALALFGTLLLASGNVHAQSIIKRPGAHPRYSVELEPHLALQWSNRFGGGDGIGPGVRVNIPFLDNGPIRSINNNMAIGVGLDLTFGDNDCRWWWGRYDRNVWLGRENCSGTEVWAPLTLQWNFFLTPVISVFGEPGFAIAHRRYSWEWWCNGANGNICGYHDSTTDVELVFWGGARFMFSDTVGATVRIGTPYVSAGINFLL